MWNKILILEKEDIFIKDLKVLEKKHYNFDNLLKIIELLQKQQPLTNKYKNHYLSGNWQGYQELHIEKDLLLIYKIIDNQILLLVRIGNHKNLLNK